MNWVILILIVTCAVILAWNFYPPFRDRMQGMSTIAEGAIGTILTYFGMFSEALQEGKDAGYIPDNIEQYVPFVILGWIIIKRIQTKSPVKGLK